MRTMTQAKSPPAILCSVFGTEPLTCFNKDNYKLLFWNSTQIVLLQTPRQKENRNTNALEFFQSTFSTRNIQANLKTTVPFS